MSESAEDKVAREWIARVEREHSAAIAEIQRNMAAMAESTKALTKDVASVTRSVDKLADRIAEDERETAAYRMGQAFTNGRNLGIGLVVVLIVSAIGSGIVQWIGRLTGAGQ